VVLPLQSKDDSQAWYWHKELLSVVVNNLHSFVSLQLILMCAGIIANRMLITLRLC